MENKKYDKNKEIGTSIFEKIEFYNYKNWYLEQERYNYKKIDLAEMINLVFKRKEGVPLSKILNYENENLIQPFYNKKSNTEHDYYPLVAEIHKKKQERTKFHNWIIKNDLSVLDNVKGKDFVISSPITYIGNNRNGNNARFCYGIVIDLDGQNEDKFGNIIHFMSVGHRLQANIIVNSGNGLHLYYIFDKPVPCYNNLKELLTRLKKGLTKRVWYQDTTLLEKIQIQPVTQGYRLPETLTKFGTVVSAYYKKDSNYLTVTQINDSLDKRDKLNEIEIKELEARNQTSKVDLEKAKELWPEWYQMRVVDKTPVKYWTLHNDGWYKQWLNKCKEETVCGHRYYALYTLAIVARKCGVEYERLKQDALSFLSVFESLTKDPENHFLEQDVYDAISVYFDDRSFKYRAQTLYNWTAFKPHEPRKKNGRTKENHFKYMLAIKQLKKEIGEHKKEGRKSKEDVVKSYLVTLTEEEKKKLSFRKLSEETNVSSPSIQKYLKLGLIQPFGKRLKESSSK